MNETMQSVLVVVLGVVAVLLGIVTVVAIMYDVPFRFKIDKKGLEGEAGKLALAV